MTSSFLTRLEPENSMLVIVDVQAGLAFFEWLKSADHPAFRAILKLVKHL